MKGIHPWFVIMIIFFMSLFGAYITFGILESSGFVDYRIQLGASIAGFVVLFIVISRFYGKAIETITSSPGEKTELIKRGNDTFLIKPGANLFGNNLSFLDLYEVNLRKANLSEANLEGTNLSNANLEGANLTNANLEGTNLSSANLRKANLSFANLEGANLSNANLESANLTNAVLKNTIVKNAILKNAVLSYVRNYDVDLTDADIRGTSLELT